MKKSKASRILGTISIVSGIFVPIVGLICGIIGLCVKKEKYERDVALNTIGIVISSLSWLIAILLFSMI